MLLTAHAERLISDPTGPDLARHLIDFDPRQPGRYQFAAPPGSADAVGLAAAQLAPDPIPWPAGTAPAFQPFPPDTTDTSPLPGADVLIVTYTVAEGYALADVLTPGTSTAGWMPYRNGWDQLRPLIAHGAPSLNPHRNQAGLWARSQLGPTSAVVVKSDLHPVTDGPKLPITALWRQMIDQVRPRLVITTGTAGGVGGDVELGDVIVTGRLRWDCTRHFAHDPFAREAFTSPELPDGSVFTTAVTDLIPVNARHLPPAGRAPQVIVVGAAGGPVSTVTTDFFAFDDASDHFGLRTYQPDAHAVEMDDAALPLAIADLADPPRWLSVRNASDPQMDGPDLQDEVKQAAAIYEKYGYWTSIGSAIACWALAVARPWTVA